MNTIIIEDPDEVISPEDLYFPKIQELLQKRFQIELDDSYDCPTIMEQSMFSISSYSILFVFIFNCNNYLRMYIIITFKQ